MHSISGIRVLFVFHCDYVSIWYSFWNTQHQVMPWSWNPDLGSFIIIENRAVQQIMYDQLLVWHCKYISILYHCQVIWHWKYRDLEIWFIGRSRSLKTVAIESLSYVFYFPCRSNCAMSLAVSTQYTNVTDRYPAIQRTHSSKGCTYA